MAVGRFQLKLLEVFSQAFNVKTNPVPAATNETADEGFD
jgi:hypothetical protein